MNFSNLAQFNHVTNHQERILDLILFNINVANLCVHGAELAIPDPSLELELYLDWSALVTTFHKKLNFRIANYDVINELIIETNWIPSLVFM